MRAPRVENKAVRIMDEETPLARDDIVFECPHCGKSMAIDQRGSGMVVVCPDCQARVQVPGPFITDNLAEIAGAPPPGGRSALDAAHVESIGKEVGLIQAALDRIVALLQDSVDRD
jgi:hypothetical protein